MSMRFDHPIYAIEPNLSASLLLLAIPLVRGTPMQQSQLVLQGFNDSMLSVLTST
jgi:hypothetical protein